MSVTSSKYSEYDQVPTHRKQWFFWLTWLIFAPIAIGLLITGDVYYRKKGEVRGFGMANRIFAGFIGLLWLAAIARAISGG